MMITFVTKQKFVEFKVNGIFFFCEIFLEMKKSLLFREREREREREVLCRFVLVFY